MRCFTICPFPRWMTFRLPCIYRHLRGVRQAGTPSSVQFDVPTARSQEHFRVLRSLDGIAKPAPDADPQRLQAAGEVNK